MKELIPTITEIVKYGLQPNLTIADKEKLLERNLVKFYSLYFDIEYKFDEVEFKDFDKSKLPDIRKNVESNFKEYGIYKSVFDLNKLDNLEESSIGDAIDDLTDIISDLLEIKWRIENNSFADGLWFFELTFTNHTQQHILNLLNYMKQKNG
ncbi:hypothetical protein ABIB40_004203 [Pedobacter sp. UYP30]|uniref:hypothetical protein n=1 Tax=Pedobacter sp. UYP30 TaxID=1756400 RepID=UPI003397A491